LLIGRPVVNLQPFVRECERATQVRRASQEKDRESRLIRTGTYIGDSCYEESVDPFPWLDLQLSVTRSTEFLENVPIYVVASDCVKRKWGWLYFRTLDFGHRDRDELGPHTPFWFRIRDDEVLVETGSWVTNASDQYLITPKNHELKSFLCASDKLEAMLERLRK